MLGPCEVFLFVEVRNVKPLQLNVGNVRLPQLRSNRIDFSIDNLFTFLVLSRCTDRLFLLDVGFGKFFKPELPGIDWRTFLKGFEVDILVDGTHQLSLIHAFFNFVCGICHVFDHLRNQALLKQIDVESVD